ncbi:MAG TPA: hypothetical protein PKJ78_21800 [Candidatus Hydrogenedentes bacterium]|nr:hypothetical protein [Candidatus Hydrogenedentota bacterium]
MANIPQDSPHEARFVAKALGRFWGTNRKLAATAQIRKTRKEVILMTIHVTVKTCQGIVAEVRGFLEKESASAAERKWLKEMNIKDKADRQARADGGTEFLVFEAELKP